MRPDELLKLAQEFESDLDGIQIDEEANSAWKDPELRAKKSLVKEQLDEIAKIRGTLLNKLRSADVYEISGMHEALSVAIEELKYAL